MASAMKCCMLMALLVLLALELIVMGVTLTRNSDGLEWATRTDDCGLGDDSDASDTLDDVTELGSLARVTTTFYSFRMCTEVAGDGEDRDCQDYGDLKDNVDSDMVDTASSSYITAASFNIANMAIALLLLALTGLVLCLSTGEGDSLHSGGAVFAGIFVVGNTVMALFSVIALAVAAANKGLNGENDYVGAGTLLENGTDCDLQEAEINYSTIAHVILAPFFLVQACIVGTGLGCHAICGDRDDEGKRASREEMKQHDREDAENTT